MSDIDGVAVNELKFSKSQLPSDRITLFDMRFTTPDERLSPYTTLIRYALKVKSIPFHVQFIDMHLVRAVSEYMGFKAVYTFPDGTPLYTLPAIWDPNGDIHNTQPDVDVAALDIGDDKNMIEHSSFKGVALSDSLPICQYLDKQYPSTPNISLIRVSSLRSDNGTNTLSFAGEADGYTLPQITNFISLYRPIDLSILPFIIPQTLPYVPAQSSPYFRRTREAWVGKTIEEMRPVGEEGVEAWGRVRAGFEALAKQRSGGGGSSGSGGGGDGEGDVGEGDSAEGAEQEFTRYGLEKRLQALKDGTRTPGYIDVFLAGRLYWIRKAFGETSDEWTNVRRWSGGLWNELLELFEERYG